ncbi:hypothetical protein MPPM_2565 [Methylorubrum populi]|uniref:Uncharacterized protein n=1 Tax=Methylorubrum populi TaxID=223967 RepID=A0A160PHU1_9HYPH|nr:hypothetical protein [Methylorubrum populi]BAU91170.1 hypothetical protein MPPM_2565 [Methylorubrum populi]
MAARDRSVCALLFGLLMSGSASAQGMALIERQEPQTPNVAGAAAQGLALIERQMPEPPRAVDDTPVKRPWMLTGRGADRDTGGRLPNQTTGPKRERVVHDICIGCGAR